MTKTYRLPPRFYEDHTARDLPEDGISAKVSENARFVYVEMDAAAYDDLLSDAEHYADEGIAAEMGLPTLAASARRTVAALNRQGRPERTP